MKALDHDRLAHCEQVIERGLGTFIGVGEALAEISQDQLYLDTHDTFEAYCRDRWGMPRQHAYRLMDAAQVTRMLSPMGDKPLPKSHVVDTVRSLPPPSGERQARALAPLKDDPKQLREVWAKVIEQHGEHVTAAKVRAVVAEYREPEETRQRTTLMRTVAQSLRDLDRACARFEAVDKAALRRNPIPLYGYSNDIQHYINRLDAVRVTLLRYAREDEEPA